MPGNRSLAGRSLLHPDIAHAIAIKEDATRKCAAIDKALEKTWAKQSTTGAHADSRERIKLAPPTLHDKAVTNPLLRDLLRKMR